MITSKDVSRFWKYVDKSGDCWNWRGSKTVFGYGQFVIAGEPRNGAHRASYRICIGPIPESMWVLHKCDNPSCVNPSHLFLGTARDNINDAIKKGRMKVGEFASNSKLSLDDVNKIRALFIQGFCQQKIADVFGVTQTTISKITRAKRWKHLGLAPLPSSGRHARGSKHPASKLKESQVREIRNLSKSHTQKELGKMFGVSQVMISKILRRDFWAWLT